MKKVYLASAMMGAAMILAAPAQAVDSTGCGLGSMAWRGQRGIGPASFGGDDQRFFRYTDFRYYFRYVRLRS